MKDLEDIYCESTWVTGIDAPSIRANDAMLKVAIEENEERSAAERHVCTNFTQSDTLRKYTTLQSAIDSVPAGDTVLIKLYCSLTGLAELTLPNANVKIIIDGQKTCSATFTTDIIEIGADRKICFTNMVNIDGGNIQLNGANAEVAFEDCQYIKGYLTLTVGAFAIIYKTSFFAPTGKAAINIDNISTPMIVGYSRIQGSTGNPAVKFTVDADDKFKAKYSSFIHGSGGANSPFAGEDVNDVTIAMYSCGLNAAFPPPISQIVLGTQTTLKIHR